MKSLLLAVLSVALALPAAASESPYGTAKTGPSDVAKPTDLGGLTKAPCPTLTAWTYCNSVHQWTQMFNDFQRAKNDVAEIQRNVDRYAMYPQKLQGYVNADLGRVEKAISKVNGLSFTDQQIQGTITKLFPDYAPGASYSGYMQKLSDSTKKSIINALKTAGLEVSTQTRDADTSEIVKDAVAKSTSPTQSNQALAQLVAVLVEQVQKEQRLSAAAMQSAGAYYLQELAHKQTATQAENAALKKWQATMNVEFPPLTAEQTRALTTGSNPAEP